MRREERELLAERSGPVWEARDRLLDAIARHKRGEVAVEVLYACADAYIAEIKAHGKRTGRKLPLPTRAGVIRALA